MNAARAIDAGIFRNTTRLGRVGLPRAVLGSARRHSDYDDPSTTMSTLGLTDIMFLHRSASARLAQVQTLHQPSLLPSRDLPHSTFSSSRLSCSPWLDTSSIRSDLSSGPGGKCSVRTEFGHGLDAEHAFVWETWRGNHALLTCCSRHPNEYKI